MLNKLSNLAYPKFKLTIVFLLAMNFFIYALTDTWIKAVDALVWLVLLILYELETNKIATDSEVLLNRLRNILIILIPLIFLGYLQSKEWLEVVNFILWIALIALLEAEIRWPEIIFQNRDAYLAATALVFAGLFAMVIVWLWRSAWLDAYDAALWLVAFATIEVDILQIFQRKQT